MLISSFYTPREHKYLTLNEIKAFRAKNALTLHLLGTYEGKKRKMYFQISQQALKIKWSIIACAYPTHTQTPSIQGKRWVKCVLTVIHIRDNCDSGCGELGAQTSPHWHAEGDIEAFLVFIQRIVNYHNPAGFLHFSLIEAQDAVMVLRPGDVIRVGQHCGGDGACGRTWGGEKKNYVRQNEWSKPCNITKKLFPHQTSAFNISWNDSRVCWG